ncbi:hypothetical protein QBC39DRAFT_161882 [Podospora conica]|nr:hypothetical protein QBC39DRAFT_161882 [Schizothecium conicum]
MSSALGSRVPDVVMDAFRGANFPGQSQQAHWFVCPMDVARRNAPGVTSSAMTSLGIRPWRGMEGTGAGIIGSRSRHHQHGLIQALETNSRFILEMGVRAQMDETDVANIPPWLPRLLPYLCACFLLREVDPTQWHTPPRPRVCSCQLLLLFGESDIKRPACFWSVACPWCGLCPVACGVATTISSQPVCKEKSIQAIQPFASDGQT